MLVFGIVEGKYTRWPIIPLAVIVQPRTLLALAVSFFIGLCMYGTITFVPVYYLMLEVQSPASSAKHILWCALGGCAGAVIAGCLVSFRGRVYYREWSVLGTALMSVGYILMYTWPQSSTATFRHAGFQVIVGLGLGFSMEQVRLAGQAGLPARDISTVTTLIDYARTLGGMIGLAVGGIIMREKMFATVSQTFPVLFGSGSLKGLDAVWLESLAPLLPTLPLTLADQLYKGIVNVLHLVFVVNVPFAVLACLLCLLLSNIPLHVVLPASLANEDSVNMADEYGIRESNK
ncbi:hypothetical protein GGI18_000999 [Coemansia linderi]|uniref:Uncharacterized protein n=1 Tax=Coemansia linderi TaxID=2663919 RepID=A0ACC1KKZ0_9FUNG|nr:hypothetical protein GGI18_000999 [Coemansia linderi]